MSQIGELFWVIVLALGFATPTYAQSGSCLHQTVPLTVHDSEGRTIHGLKPSDFEGKYKGQPVKIVSIVPDDRPHRVVILLDASGSMARVWKPALAVASDLAEAHLANTEIGLIIFNEKVTEQIDFRKGQGSVAERLRQILADDAYAGKLAHKKTALYDSLLAGLQVLGSPT